MSLSNSKDKCCVVLILFTVICNAPVFFQHVFLAQTGLTRRLAVDLLDKMNNPDNHQHYGEVDDDDLEVIRRIISSNTLQDLILKLLILSGTGSPSLLCGSPRGGTSSV